MKNLEELEVQTLEKQNLEKIRNLCDNLLTQRKEEVKLILSDWLEYCFIRVNKPWRAFVGKRKFRPIPIHRSFSLAKLTEPYKQGTIYKSWSYFSWPDLPDSIIIEVLENLGFVVSGPRICLSVPIHKKGEPYTFAQEWVKRINHNYSLYVASEKKLAKTYYSMVLSDLCNYPHEKILSRDGYTLFSYFTFETELNRSKKCNFTLFQLLKGVGIEPYFEDGEYAGLRVWDTSPFPCS